MADRNAFNRRSVLYVVCRWAKAMKLDLAGLEHLAAFNQRMDADAGVQKLIKAEGLN